MLTLPTLANGVLLNYHLTLMRASVRHCMGVCAFDWVGWVMLGLVAQLSKNAK